MNSQQIVEEGRQVLTPNYARLPIAMARGQGARLWDADGKQYIDLFAGFGGAILGHCHPDLIAAARKQADTLWHVGNALWTTPQIDFATRISRHAFPGLAFFCHSGLEANEAAVKLARLRGAASSPARWKVITLHRSFHGRSLAMIAATGNPAVKAGFEPPVPGFVHVEPGDLAALAAAVDDQTCAILLEPIQGEGGMNEHAVDYIAGVRRLCDEKGLTLIFDEVWTGGARTGEWFGHQHFKLDGKVIEPDIMTLGKAVGGGLPVGAMYARTEVGQLLVPGKHGCTLGGNPICMAVASAIFDVIERDNLVDRARRLGDQITARLKDEPRLRGKVAAIRGRGLMLGVELSAVPDKLVERGLAAGILINVTAQKVVRLAPALTIPDADLDAGLDKLIDLLGGS